MLIAGGNVYSGTSTAMNARAALELVDELDELLVTLLETARNVYSDEGYELVEQAATRHVQTAAKLQRTLADLKRAANPLTEADSLRKELAELDQEIQLKDALLLDCRLKIQKWKTKCEQLQQLHAETASKGLV